MNADTTIAKNIRVADEKASYDAACKRLLSEKIILAWIMKNCLEEYRNCDVDEIAEKYIEGTPQVGEVAVAPDESNHISMIHGAGNEDTSPTEGTVTYESAKEPWKQHYPLLHYGRKSGGKCKRKKSRL